MIRSAVLALCLLSAPVWAADGLRVVDGDGLHLDGREVRLWGIDAPEKTQSCAAHGERYACGLVALDQFEALTAGQAVSCATVNRDHYGRHVSRCEVAGDDLAALMVRSGWALDWPKYSGGWYAAQQSAAEAVGRGLHAGQFVPPWVWRRSR